MRVNPGQQSTARQADYDRNSTNVTQQYANGNAPHGNTVRWTYTVPANRKARFTYFYIDMNRAAVATTAVELFTLIGYTPIAGNVTNIGEIIGNPANVLFTDFAMSGSPQMIMFAGDVLNCRNFNGDTGGTVNETAQATGIEFDA